MTPGLQRRVGRLYLYSATNISGEYCSVITTMTFKCKARMSLGSSKCLKTGVNTHFLELFVSMVGWQKWFGISSIKSMGKWFYINEDGRKTVAIVAAISDFTGCVFFAPPYRTVLGQGMGQVFQSVVKLGKLMWGRIGEKSLSSGRNKFPVSLYW